jgi:hypothetical protein
MRYASPVRREGQRPPLSLPLFQPRVSTLGNPPPRRCALKGRQIRRGKTHVENELAHVSSRPFRAREMQDEKD